MKAEKTLGSSGNRKITIYVESERECEILKAMFHDTYKLQKIANENTGNQYEHAEIKHVADVIYVQTI